MAAQKITKKQAKINDARVSKIYGRRCHGVQVPIMELGKIMQVGTTALLEGADDQVIGDKIVEYVKTIMVGADSDASIRG